jgi:hypothetical protein
MTDFLLDQLELLACTYNVQFSIVKPTSEYMYTITVGKYSYVCFKLTDKELMRANIKLQALFERDDLLKERK